MNWLKEISSYLMEHQFTDAPFLNSERISGGCINKAFQISNNSDRFFIKTNQKSAYPLLFEKEIKGLQLIHNSNTIAVPKVITSFNIGNESFLLLEWIETSQPSNQFWFTFGQQLAELHLHSHHQFGLDHDNYIGSLIQKNEFHGTFESFFLFNRLIPQLELGKEIGWVDKQLYQHADNIAYLIENEFPKEKPSLLHGDLWNGNFMIGKSDCPYLIDPAVYYGFREMDLAMTYLFGGFHEEFYASYQAHFPIAADFKSRLLLLQLYPILVHANIFGGNYIDQSKNILRKY